jgi:hypothetical protein
MDSSLHSNTSTVVTAQDVAEAKVEEEHHVHLPNPSFWPIILSAAVVVTVSGVLFFPDNPWLSIIGAPFVLICMVAWALEDSMAPVKEKFLRVAVDHSMFAIGQEVIDKDGFSIGKVQARFKRYILVESGGLLNKVYYVPQSIAKSSPRKRLVALSLSEQELSDKGYNRLPDDLYDEVPNYGVPIVSGMPQYSRGPLSPAETGHYNYGPRYPGINTDASGSYHRQEVNPTPQTFVAEWRDSYSTSKNIPASDLPSD